MADEQPEQTETVEGSAYRAKVELGLIVAVALAILTLIEYFIAVEVENPTIWLVPFAVAKGALILEFFMHFSSIVEGDDH